MDGLIHEHQQWVRYWLTVLTLPQQPPNTPHADAVTFRYHPLKLASRTSRHDLALLRFGQSLGQCPARTFG